MWTSPQDKAKVEIRKLSSPPQAEAVRDMVRYARNVIEEFRRAKHYKYNLSVAASLQRVAGSLGGGGALNVEACPLSACGKTGAPQYQCPCWMIVTRSATWGKPPGGATRAISVQVRGLPSSQGH